ncbi:DUF11 domain-containing protein [Miltoncostaea oceani]|uniref:DUF11 domain-containing protein n=1 Tax=Miltoncostaea oceani TaxID=2843216 RepID=UPI001C3E1BB2|nr:DUF11 domain-containing protein [Miltoncostaea oceani]
MKMATPTVRSTSAAPGPLTATLAAQATPSDPAIRHRRIGSTARRAATLCALGTVLLSAPALAAAAPGDAPAANCPDGIVLGVGIAPPATVAPGQTQTFDYTVCDRVVSDSEYVTSQVVRLQDPRRSPTYPGNAVPMTPANRSAYPNMSGTYTVPMGSAPGTYSVVVNYYSSPGALNSQATINFGVAAPTVAPPSTPASPMPEPISPAPVAPAPAAAPAPVFVPRGEPGPVARPLAARLALVKTADRRVVRAGGTVRWTLRLRSTGTGAARAVQLCDTLPRGMSLVRAPGAKLRGGKVCWSLGTLAPGASRVRVLTSRVDRNIGTARLMTNRAAATASNAPRVADDASVSALGSPRQRTVATTG